MGRQDQIQKVLETLLQPSQLCRLCVEYAELPQNQLWIFLHYQLIRFDPQTSKMFTYDYQEPSSLASSWSYPGRPTFTALWNPTATTADFMFLKKNSLQFGTLSDSELKITENLEMEFSESVYFSFTFQNQFYTIGETSFVWVNLDEKKEIPTLSSDDNWKSTWIVHDEYLYQFLEGTTSRYSLGSFTKTNLPCSCSARLFGSATLHPQSNRIFISGGFRSGHPFYSNSHIAHIAYIDIFDIKTQQFVPKKFWMPHSLWNHYSFCLNNFYFLIGGEDWLDTKNRKIWKHALTSEGTPIGEWILVSSDSCEVFAYGCLFG